MIYLVNISKEIDKFGCKFTFGKLYPADNDTVTDDDGVSSNLYPLYRYELVIDL